MIKIQYEIVCDRCRQSYDWANANSKKKAEKLVLDGRPIIVDLIY